MEEIQSEDLEFIFPIISGKVSMAINRMMYRNFRKENLDITPEQWTVLAFLWVDDGVTQQRLCDATFKDKPSMTRLIDNLVKQGLVYRQPSPEDRRSNLIYLTTVGKEIEARANMAAHDAAKAALNGVSNEELEKIRYYLKIVFGNIKKALEDK